MALIDADADSPLNPHLHIIYKQVGVKFQGKRWYGCLPLPLEKVEEYQGRKRIAFMLQTPQADNVQENNRCCEI
jgi:hypothetical protein